MNKRQRTSKKNKPNAKAVSSVVNSHKKNELEQIKPAEKIDEVKQYEGPNKSTIESKIKYIWQKLTNFFKRFYKTISVIITVTGITIFSFLPGTELQLSNPTDPSRLVLELKNTSFISIDSVRSYLYIDKIETSQGEKTQSRIINLDNNDILKLGGKETNGIEYNLNLLLYDDFRPLQIFEANIAIVVTYRFLTFSRKDSYFFACKPNYMGGYIWTKMREQPFVDKLDNSKNTINLNDLPNIKRYEELLRQGKIKKVPYPPRPKGPLD